MIGKKILASILLFASMAVIYITGSSRSSGVDSPSCQGCHSGSSVFNDVFVMDIPDNPVPGQTYTGRVVIRDGDGVVGGFHLRTTSGTFGLIAGQGTRLFSNSTVITHAGTRAFDMVPAGSGLVDSVSWSFNWTAPASSGASVNFTIQGNAANGNGANSGDVIHQNTKGFVLPVTWGDIKVIQKEDLRVISWETLDETNNDYFTIERSTDGRSFESIGEQTATGGQELTSYEYRDDQLLLANKVYYKVKQTDYDGRSNYSQIVSVENDLNDRVSIYPNPSLQGESLNIIRPEGVSHVLVTDMLGRTVDMITASGRTAIDYERGMYQVLFMAETQIVTSQQLIVQ